MTWVELFFTSPRPELKYRRPLAQDKQTGKLKNSMDNCHLNSKSQTLNESILVFVPILDRNLAQLELVGHVVQGSFKDRAPVQILHMTLTKPEGRTLVPNEKIRT